MEHQDLHPVDTLLVVEEDLQVDRDRQLQDLVVLVEEEMAIY